MTLTLTIEPVGLLLVGSTLTLLALVGAYTFMVAYLNQTPTHHVQEFVEAVPDEELEDDGR